MDLSAFDNIDFSQLEAEELADLLAEIDRLEKVDRFKRFDVFFPDDGPFRRELYPKHTEFFDAGRTFMERCFMAANRVGKTETGAYESTCHLTGHYPHWWTGRVWKRPISAWVAGDTNESTRDVIQKKLLGGIEWHGDKKGVDGTGMIPRDSIDQSSITWKAGVADLIDTVKIKHRLGGRSTLGFKAYAQGRKSMQGTEQDLIWVDEEPPEDVYSEMLVRLMTTNGLAMLTFTPLEGMSKVVEQFQPQEARALDA